MTDLLSALDKSNIHEMFDNLHDTFARDIKIYIIEETTIIDTDGNHNPLYGDTDHGKTVENVKEYSKKARIKYSTSQDRTFGPIGGDSQLNVTFPRGLIRLKVDEETYGLITKAKKIMIDDRLCELVSSPARPGPFNPNYWTIELKQID